MADDKVKLSSTDSSYYNISEHSGNYAITERETFPLDFPIVFGNVVQEFTITSTNG